MYAMYTKIITNIKTNKSLKSFSCCKSNTQGVCLEVNHDKDYSEIFLLPFLFEGIQLNLKHKSFNFGVVLTRTMPTYS